MSILVELAGIRAAAAEQAPFAYLLTVSDASVTHLVAITPEFDGDEIVCAAGRSTCANAGARPDVVLLWPPARPDDFSLVVDGVARVDGDRVTIRPTHAVKHRPAPGLAPA